MISYDKYQNRIKRLAAVKNFIVRFRALFITLFAVLIAASLGLMFTKGMITKSIILPDKIIYGDNYGVEIQPPKAFLSDVEYQFKRVKDENDVKSAAKRSLTDDEQTEDDEWTNELPTYAGKYLVRMVTSKIFGKSYSNPKEFEIETKPIDFVIKSNSVVYGEMPENYDFSTVKGDSFDADSVRFNYENPAADSTIVWADKDSFRIYNSKGVDVTFCYNISVPKTEEEVKIEQKYEKITLQSLQTEYIGAEIDYENGVLHFKGGDAYIETKIYRSGDSSKTEIKPVNVDSYTVEVTGVKVYKGDVDVTNHYQFDEFKNITATIKVNKRPVTVTTQSATKEYDGTPLKATSVEAEGLIEGHTLDTKLKENAINAGSYRNECESIKITDKDGEVTSNYEITYVYGTLEVTRRKITLTTHDDEKVYDGTPDFKFDDSSYSIDKEGGKALVSGHTATVKFNNRNSDTGSHSNVATLTVKDGEGKDIGRNYEILENFGTLTISKRAIEVTTHDGNFPYNGSAQSNPNITDADIVLLSDVGEDTNALAGGEWYTVVNSTEITYFTTDEVKNEVEIVIRNSYGAVTNQNYDIKFKCGKLTIIPVGITIENKSGRREYNGKPLQGYGTEVTPVATWLMGNDRLVPDVLSELTDVGEIDNKTTYRIVNSANFDVTDSYIIGYTGNAKLTVIQASLKIYTPNVERVYDGTPLLGSDERYGAPPVFSGLAAGDGYRAYGATEQIDAGSAQNKTQYTFYAVRNGKEVSTTGNYVIEYAGYGYVRVTPRPVCIVTADGSREYDGTPFSNKTGWCDDSTGYGLLADHELVVDGNNYASITDVKYDGNGNVIGISNAISFKVYHGITDVSENYDLVNYHKYGTLTITPRIVRVTTASLHKTYNAQSWSDNSINCLHGSGTNKDNFIPDGKEAFVSGQSLSITTNGFINAGEHDNNYVTFTLSGGDVKNYSLIWNIGKIIIDKRPIEITTASGSKVYDDTSFTITAPEKYDVYVPGGAERGLLSGHYIEHDSSKFSGSVTYVWEEKVENEQYYRIFGNSGEVTGNYEITIHRGEIWIEVREITLATDSGTKEFDGLKYQNTNYTVSGKGLVSGHNFKFINWPSVTFVTDGEVLNEPEFTIERDGIDLTDNYAVTPKYGKISRTKRYVKVTSNNREWTYDGEWHSETGYTSVHLNGGVPDGTAGLVLGHELEAVTYAKIKEYKENTAKNNAVTYRFKDSKVSENYIVSYDSGTISIAKRRIIVTVNDGEGLYNGEEFSYTEDYIVEGEYDVNGNKLTFGLVSGHILKATYAKTITDVKRDSNDKAIGVENEVLYKVVAEGGGDVDDNYLIVRYNYGTIKLNPRPIKMYTDSASQTYNGTPLICENYWPETVNSANTRGLLAIHVNSVEPLGSPASITYIKKEPNGNEVYKAPNVRYFLIKDGNPDREGGNYEIEYVFGTLTIEKRTLTVTTKDRTWNYNGTVHYVEESNVQAQYAEFGNIVASEICFAVEGKIANIIDYSVNGVRNDTQYRIFTSDKSVETTYCYDISYGGYGTLYVNRINLVITTITADKVYDGTPLSGSDERYGSPVFSGLIAGEGHEAFNATQITDFGTTKNKTEYKFYANRAEGKKETTQNYIISYIEGDLSISKRTIWVVSGSAEKEYDGAELTCKTGWYITGALDLVEGHTLEAVTFTSVTDVKRDENDRATAYANVVTYKVIIKGNSNSDVDKNYTIKYLNAEGEEEYGKLLITPRIIRVTTDSAEWTYDAEWHFKASEKSEHGSFKEDGTFVPSSDARTFVLNHILVRSGECKVKDAGTSPNKYEYDVKDGNVSVIYNYDLTVVYGELKIKPRPIKITTATVEEEYDGKAHSSSEFTYEEFKKSEERGLVEGHEVELASNQTFKSVTNVLEGKIQNIFAVEIFENNEKVTQNYKIEYQYGTLSVTPRIIRVTTGSLECPYDGKEHSRLYETYVHGSFKDGRFIPDEEPDFVLGHRLDRLTATVEIDAGEYDNEITYRVLDVSGNPVTSNYSLDVVCGKIVITKIKLTIKTATLEKVYDGTPLYGDDNSKTYGTSVVITGLAEGEYEEALNPVRITNCGTVINTTRYEIYRTSFGNAVKTTQNYDPIEYENGTLTITQRVIWVVSGSAKRQYDGTPIFKLDGWTVTGQFDVYGNTLETGLVAGHTLKAVQYISFTDVERDSYGNVVSVPNIVKYKVIVEGDESAEVDGNYRIEYLSASGKDDNDAYGTLLITPRTITVKTATDSKDYDGTPLVNTKDAIVTKGSLVKGHSLYVEEGVSVASVTDVCEGSVPNIIGKYSVSGPDGDVSDNYEITFDEVCGTLTILPRDITIVLNTVENFEYGNEFAGYPVVNGKMFDYLNGSKQTVDGEKLVITVKYRLGGVDIDVYGRLGVGRYSVVLDTTEIDGGRGRVDNYNIIVANTTFEVLKRKITIYLLEQGNGGKVYDGKEFEFDGTAGNGYELAAGSTLAYQDELTIKVRYFLNGTYIVGNPLDAGEYTVEVNAVTSEVSDGAEEPKITPANSSYEITAQALTYVITRRPLIFGIKDIQHEYMGEIEYTFSDDDAMSFDYSQLAEIDFLTSVKATVDANAVEVGKYDYYVYGFEIERENGDDATGNYYLSENQPRATLEILKREIKVSVYFEGTASREFTGEEIDLIEEYKPYGQEYGPFNAVPVNEGVGDYGIYAGDLDKIRFVFTSYQNGAETELIMLGLYDVSVALIDKEDYDVLKNYAITYEDGEFSITRRQIIVTPKMTAEELVYNGEKLDADNYLDYDTRHYFSGTAGLFDSSHKAYFKETYTLYNNTTRSEASLDDILQAGTYSLKVRLEYVTDKEDEVLYDIVEYVDSVIFTVSKRWIFINTPDDNTAYVYNKTAAKTPEQYTVYYYDDGWKEADGVDYIEKDFTGTAPMYVYSKLNGSSYASAVDAGEYEILVTELTGGNSTYIKTNYTFIPSVDGGLKNGRLTIKPAVLIVTPKDHAVDYDGTIEVLTYPDGNADIKYVENNPARTLFGNDELSYVVKGSVNIRKISYTYVSFSSVTINERDSGRDVTSNYDLVYSYAQLKKTCPDMVSAYESEEFRATLKFNKVTLRIKQPALPSPKEDPTRYTEIMYGTMITIPAGAIDLPAENITTEDLITGHSVVPVDSMVTAVQAKDIEKWLSVKVLDGNQADVTLGYNIVLDCTNEAGHIKLKQRELVIKVDFAPSDYAEGQVVPSEDYRITEGSLIQSASLEISVKNGKFVAHMENKLYGDVTYGYSVEYAYPGTENYKKEAEYASRIQSILSRRTEIIRKDDLS